MKKRDFLKEITSIKQRNLYNDRWDMSDRLRVLEKELNFLKKHLKESEISNELLKYFPIALVACAEGYFRLIIKELIDFGSPYSDNAKQLDKSRDIKFDFDVVFAIKGQKLTIGEFISHLLPINNITDIEKNLTIIIGENFFKSVKKIKVNRWYEDEEVVNTFKNDFDKIYVNVQKTFETRHIFCHELATNHSIDIKTVEEYFSAMRVFLLGSANFIFNLLYPDEPYTQTEMNIKARNDYDKLELKQKELIEKIMPFLDSKQKETLKQLEESWEKTARLEGDFFASYVEGGTLYPLIYASQLSSFKKYTIKELEDTYNHWKELFGEN